MKSVFFLEAPPRFELGVKVLQTSALPLGYGAIYYNIWSGMKKLPDSLHLFTKKLASKGLEASFKLERKTRFELATFTLARWRSTTEPLPHHNRTENWCLRVESNRRHKDFQSFALPTELQRQIWRPEGGSNPRPPAWQAGILTNWTIGPFSRDEMVGATGLEPVTLCL